MKGQKWFYNAARFPVRKVLKKWLHVRVDGLEKLREGPYLLTPRHLSTRDTVILPGFMPGIINSFINDRYFQNSLFRIGLEMVFVHSVNGMDSARSWIGSARKGISHRNKVSKDAIEKTQHLAIYPEGRLSNSGRLLPFKRGFIRMLNYIDSNLGGIGIVPVSVTYDPHPYAPDVHTHLSFGDPKPSNELLAEESPEAALQTAVAKTARVTFYSLAAETLLGTPSLHRNDLLSDVVRKARTVNAAGRNIDERLDREQHLLAEYERFVRDPTLPLIVDGGEICADRFTVPFVEESIIPFRQVTINKRSVIIYHYGSKFSAHLNERGIGLLIPKRHLDFYADSPDELEENLRETLPLFPTYEKRENLLQYVVNQVTG